MPTAHARRVTQRVAQRARRRDFLRNQHIVLEAARDVLSTQGTEATMELIAARAGVGVGTVYRHFPNKDALIDALVRSIIDELLNAAATAAGRGGSGLEEFLRVLGHCFTAHRGYARMLVGNTSAARGAHTLRSMIAQLLDQARNSGDIGPDVTPGDIMTVVWALRGIVETSGAVTPVAWQRHLDIHLAALRAPQIPSTQPAITNRQLAAITTANSSGEWPEGRRSTRFNRGSQ
jgi:AcrR family transcriptional regulator